MQMVAMIQIIPNGLFSIHKRDLVVQLDCRSRMRDLKVISLDAGNVVFRWSGEWMLGQKFLAFPGFPLVGLLPVKKLSMFQIHL